VETFRGKGSWIGRERGKLKVGELVRTVCCEGEGYVEKQKKLLGNKDSEGRRSRFEGLDAG